MTKQSRRYLIHGKAPNPTRLRDFLRNDEPNRPDREFDTTFRAYVTVDEFHAMYGDDANILHYMRYHADGRDGWTINIGVEDVLCSESWYGMQYVLIKALRERDGLTPLSPEETAAVARNYADITPDAALFLMEMFDYAHSPDEIDLAEQISRFDADGFSLDDISR